MLAFSAIRNNDKVGLLLFTDEVEKFIPPRKGRRHVLRVIREILFFEPKRRGTDLNVALQFLDRVTPHRAIAIVLSDFLVSQSPSGSAGGPFEALAQKCRAVLRQTNRRHDVVAVQIADRYEFELPAIGRLILEDAETGQHLLVDTSSRKGREAHAAAARQRAERMRQLARSSRGASGAISWQ